MKVLEKVLAFFIILFGSRKSNNFLFVLVSETFLLLYFINKTIKLFCLRRWSLWPECTHSMCNTEM